FDLDARRQPERTSEIALLRRYREAMIVRELLAAVAVHAPDAAVTDVEEMRLSRLDHQRTERADVASIPVVGEGSACGLRVQPRVRGRDDEMSRRLDRQ